MKADLKAKWIEALRSGEYEQCKDKLYSGNGYCCLGVLCVVSGAKFEQQDGEFVPYLEQENIRNPDGNEFLCSDFAMKVGLSRQTQLADMNDNGASFSEIADYIEKNL